MATSHVARAIVGIGGNPKIRRDFVTDNGNAILDVHGLSIENAVQVEQQLNKIVGVVTNGLFASRHADLMVVGGKNGVNVTRI